MNLEEKFNILVNKMNFGHYDEVIFGDSSLSGTTLSVTADSVTILAHSITLDNQTSDENNTSNNNSEQNNQTNQDTNNSTEENQTQEQEMKTCEGCCGATSEVLISQPCPVISCDTCEESEETEQETSQSQQGLKIDFPHRSPGDLSGAKFSQSLPWPLEEIWKRLVTFRQKFARFHEV